MPHPPLPGGDCLVDEIVLAQLQEGENRSVQNIFPSTPWEHLQHTSAG